jgi:hypothetical protein
MEGCDMFTESKTRIVCCISARSWAELMCNWDENGGVANRSVFESEISQDGYPDVFIYQVNLPLSPHPAGSNICRSRGDSMACIPRLPGLRLHQWQAMDMVTWGNETDKAAERAVLLLY